MIIWVRSPVGDDSDYDLALFHKRDVAMASLPGVEWEPAYWGEDSVRSVLPPDAPTTATRWYIWPEFLHVALRCEHGVLTPNPMAEPIAWAGGISTCDCCGLGFCFVCHGSMDSSGWGEWTDWEPKDRCGPCGGGYVQYSSGTRPVSKAEPTGKPLGLDPERLP